MASASLLSFSPSSPLLAFPSTGRSRAPNPLSRRLFTNNPPPPLRRGSAAVRMSMRGELPDLESIEGVARELFGRAEGIVYTLADAAVSSPTDVSGAPERTSDWLSGITSYMETILKVLKDGLSALHVPYAYGFAIILLTILVKAATFPLTKKQVESALAMRSLQPQVKAVQERYAGDPEKIQLETARLYKLAGVNPLAGCLPTLATIPVWIGLYRALSNVANEGLLTEGFFWIPSLAGPTTVAARQSGSGISWLFPFIDGHPPLGWPDTLAYLVLPVLLIISQYISAQIMQPSQGNDPNQKSSQAVTKILPLVIGYFSLSVPSGLSLYWFTNNVLSTAQQVWLQKLGGAQNPVKQYIGRTSKDELSSIQNPSSNLQKSALDIDTSNVKSDPVEKADSGGLRPGERFKKIKEEEARRRKQREEASASSDTAVDKQDTQFILTENTDAQVLEEKQTELRTSTTNNGAFNYSNGSTGKNEEHLHENVPKDEDAEKHASTGNQTYSPDTQSEDRENEA